MRGALVLIAKHTAKSMGIWERPANGPLHRCALCSDDGRQRKTSTIPDTVITRVHCTVSMEHQRGRLASEV